MAIAKMRKLHLVAMSYDKDAILNALQRTGAVEVSLHAETEHTSVGTFDAEALRVHYASVEAALFALCREVETYEKDNNLYSGMLKDGFDVNYFDFMSAKDKRSETERVVESVNALADCGNELKGELAKVKKQIEAARIYSVLDITFARIADTPHVRVRLGCMPLTALDNVQKELSAYDLCEYKGLNVDGDNALVLITSHSSVSSQTDGVLSAYGFSECPYTGERTGKEIYDEYINKEKALLQAQKENAYTMYALKDKIHDLKIYSDYLSFELEKAQTSEKTRVTEHTFLLQAYLPETAEENVAAAIKSASDVVYFSFSDPTDEDTPPTLLINNAIVSNFESITNTYSTPNYREFDPNAIMAFFYSLFMGFIIGDAGYGILMLLVGGYIWWSKRNRPTGMSKMAGSFAIGGFFAIIWGLLFNSLFGFMVLPVTVMPNPQTDMWLLAGISVPSVLIISMELGVVQIFAGYMCRAVQEWRRGNIVDGICDGVLWSLFSVGVGLAIIGFVDEAGVPLLGMIGGITAGASLLLAMLTAGRKEKFFGKFTKGFGAAYGVINYASDILSYARLYGLMLSGAVIAGIIANYSGQFLMSGQLPMIILAVVLLIIGHGFNLVMNLLGAYIHDARLQYVEFYGRFFEGEGELFKPLGGEQKYIYLLRKNGDKTERSA